MVKTAVWAHAQVLLEIDREQDLLAVGALQERFRLRTQGAEITSWGVLISDEKTRLLLANAEASWLRAAQDLCRWDADANRGGSLTRLTVPYCMADLARRQTQVISKFRDEGNG